MRKVPTIAGIRFFREAAPRNSLLMLLTIYGYLWLTPVRLAHSHPLPPLAAMVLGNDAQFIDAMQLDRPELPPPGCLADGYGFHDSAADGFHQAHGLPIGRGTMRHGQIGRASWRERVG